MAGNSYGTLFRITTFGESHGEALGGIIDGCPAGIETRFRSNSIRNATPKTRTIINCYPTKRRR